MYSLTLPFSYLRESDVCKLIVHWRGEGMATEVTKYNYPTLWKFFEICLSLFCLPVSKTCQPQSDDWWVYVQL